MADIKVYTKHRLKPYGLQHHEAQNHYGAKGPQNPPHL